MKLITKTVFAVLLGVSALASHAAAVVTYFHNDASGTPLLATNAAGVEVWRENYRPYGDRLTLEDDSLNNKISFHGKPFDASTGLSYMGARYYHPTLGRFMGMDPASVAPDELHSFNRYAYANNNPYRYVDPDGHAPTPIDVAFLMWDIGKLGLAMYTGVGIGAAAADVGASAVGIFVPIPLAGQAIKAARATEHAIEAVRAADHVVDAARAAKQATAVRNARLAGSTHPKTGIPFDKNGFPDFSSVAKAEVKITQTGKRAGDFREANKAAGLKKTPEDYTWHHHQDGTTMQLVPRKIHEATGHTGGVALGS